jgi:hypothetical protein
VNIHAINTLKLARKVYSSVFDQGKTGGPAAQPEMISGQAASDAIRDKLLSPHPAMIARFGAVELNCLTNYLSIKYHQNNFAGYIRGTVSHFWWDKSTIRMMADNAGFFPSNPETLSAFSELMIRDMEMLDILGSWQKQESFFNDKLTGVTRVRLLDLEPYNHDQPWSAALAGKKVLVVHPFDISIRRQYAKRELLFPIKDILPEFELKTIKAVQSIANNATGLKNWFQALDYMKDQITGTDFDIAVIGCGAYGFPLAAHVKRLGKKAVHLGGATQALFGIKGKRWEQQKEHERVSRMMNEHWSRPLPEETPSGIMKVEGGCYW